MRVRRETTGSSAAQAKIGMSRPEPPGRAGATTARPEGGSGEVAAVGRIAEPPEAAAQPGDGADGGAATSSPCPICERSNLPDARFCAGCGHRLPCAGTSPSCAPVEGRSAEDERSPPTPTGISPRDELGERKPATVLFVNLHGSLDLSNALDPEQWHRVVTRFFAILADAVRSHGGVIDRFTGAGIKARFGAPIAHEEHARQACDTALDLAQELHVLGQELRRTLGINFSVRMGLSSGEVLFGPIGGEEGHAVSAQGHTAALAARMEQLAEPGRIYLTEHTARLVRDLFRLTDLGRFTLRGVGTALRVYRLEGRGERGLRPSAVRTRASSRLVGREAELARLDAALDRAVRLGRMQLVGIVGEAGVGKSRLCEELHRRCLERGSPVFHLSLTDPMRGLPLGSVRQYLDAFFEVDEGEDRRAAREKIAGRLLMLDPGLRSALQVVFDAAGLGSADGPALPVDREARIERLALLTRRIIEGQASDAAQVYIVDDRHLADAASDAVTNQVPWHEIAVPALGVLTYRPGFHRPWMDRGVFEELVLEPLAADAFAELVREILGTHASVAEIATEIRALAGGNPFFVEELIHSLVDAGTLVGQPGNYLAVAPSERTALPATLHAVLAARIDRLDERSKALLQAASVIGPRFAAALLAHTTDLSEDEVWATLRALEQQGLLRQEPGTRDDLFAFRHLLMQEAAYRSLVCSRRDRLHATVASLVEQAVETDGDSRAALVALHRERASEPLEAARWYRRAAAFSASRDPEATIGHWGKVRDLLATCESTPETRGLQLAACLGELQNGWYQGLDCDRAALLHGEGRRLAEQAGDRTAQSLVTASYADVLAIAGRVEEAILLGREACNLADHHGDPALRMALRVRFAFALYDRGDQRATVATCDQGLSVSRDPDLGLALVGFSPALYLRMIRALAQVDLGRLASGSAEVDAIAVAARERNDGRLRCMAVASQAVVQRFTGMSPVGGVAAQMENVALANDLGGHLLRIFSRTCLAITQVFARELHDARANLEQAHALIEGAGLPFYTDASCLSLLAVVHSALGDYRAAMELAERALARTCGRHRALWEIDARLRWAHVARLADAAPRERIADELHTALRMTRAIAARSREPLIRSGLADLAAWRGDFTQQRAELEEGRRVARELGMCSGHIEKLLRG